MANSHTPLPPCLACGIKPPLSLLLKATISNSFRHESSSAATPTQALQEGGQQYDESGTANPVNSPDYSTAPAQKSSIRCPRCTFRNHPSLLTCEICDAPLSTNNSAPPSLRSESSRADSPGPSLDSTGRVLNLSPEYVKISFRAGGEKIFHERLRGAMIQRRWLLKNAPPIPQPNYNITDSAGALANLHVGTGGHVVNERPRAVGIAGLERRGLELRKNNETVISNAFEDLEALMASAKEIIALAESFSNNSSNDSQEANEILKESAAALGMVTTKAMLGSNSGSDSLYISELSRSLAEYLTDDRRGILRKEGGIMSLVDLWAIFNRASTGVELVYPPEFEKAAQMWEKLGLPVRLRKFRNGLMVVQRHDWTDDKCIAQLLAWLQDLRLSPTLEDAGANSHVFGRGVTAQDAAARFGWSVGVASEELEMAEEKGALCREESIEGLRFWENGLLNNLT
jgi:ESCRT-II complex subunit VPS36